MVVVTPAIGRVPEGLRDSKLLTPAARDALVAPVRRWAEEFAVGHASADEIDAIGLMAALRTAARRALAQLAGPVDAVLLDGNHDYLNSPLQAALFEPVAGPPVDNGTRLTVHVRIKADLTCAAVAGASVLAKTERDRQLIELAPLHPLYNFAINKGYGTPEHLAALRAHGPSPVHRRSWRLGVDAPSGSAADAVGDLPILDSDLMDDVAEPTPPNARVAPSEGLEHRT